MAHRQVSQEQCVRPQSPPTQMADWNAIFDDEGVPTRTSTEQEQTESACEQTFAEWLNMDGSLSRESCGTITLSLSLIHI